MKEKTMHSHGCLKMRYPWGTVVVLALVVAWFFVHPFFYPQVYKWEGDVKIDSRLYNKTGFSLWVNTKNVTMSGSVPGYCREHFPTTPFSLLPYNPVSVTVDNVTRELDVTVDENGQLGWMNGTNQKVDQLYFDQFMKEFHVIAFVDVKYDNYQPDQPTSTVHITCVVRRTK